MSVDRAEVERIARLARLRLDEAEATRLVDEMNRILEHAGRLVDVAPPEPGEDIDIATAMGGVRHGRADPDPLAAPPSAIAPSWQESFFTVPPPPGVAVPDPAESE